MDEFKQHQCQFMPQIGVSVYTQHSQTDSRLSISKLVVERLATEDDLEENHLLEEVGKSIWTFTADIYNCPYCGSELTASGSVDKDNFEVDGEYGAFTFFDQENWNGRLR